MHAFGGTDAGRAHTQLCAFVAARLPSSSGAYFRSSPREIAERTVDRFRFFGPYRHIGAAPGQALPTDTRHPNSQGSNWPKKPVTEVTQKAAPGGQTGCRVVL